jgi:hypothetical protein
MDEELHEIQIVADHKKSGNHIKGSILQHVEMRALKRMAKNRVNALNEEYKGRGWEYRYVVNY